MDHIRYLFNLVGDPIGNLIETARSARENSDSLRYPYLFQRLVEAVGVRRPDDQAAVEVGVRNTLFTILLDHTHHARDRREVVE